MRALGGAFIAPACFATVLQGCGSSRATNQTATGSGTTSVASSTAMPSPTDTVYANVGDLTILNASEGDSHNVSALYFIVQTPAMPTSSSVPPRTQAR